MAEFNTYDILKQRYLLLTREALAVLKERVKQEAGPPPDRRRGRRAGRPGGLSPMVTLRRPPQYRAQPARSWSRTR